MSVTYGGDTITFADNSTIGSGWSGFKNRFINGAITIDQRANTQMGLANAAAYYYCADRWQFYQDTTGLVGTVRPSTVAPAGFANSIAISVTTANTVSAGHQNILTHWFEWNNVYDLAWGTESAAPVTLSFWVRSSITGTNGGMISNAAFTRNYTFSYTVNAQNTWEYKTVTIPGDTTGTWTQGAGGTGMRLRLNTGSGSNYLGTANTWGTGIYNAPTGSFSTVGTTGATLYFTGFQLERGSSASSFEYRPLGVELMMCQRYYEEQFLQWATAWSAGMNNYSGTFKVTKRVAPTTAAVYASGSNDKTGTLGSVRNTTNSADISCNAVSCDSPNNFSLDYNTGSASARNMRAYVTFSSELT